MEHRKFGTGDPETQSDDSIIEHVNHTRSARARFLMRIAAFGLAFVLATLYDPMIDIEPSNDNVEHTKVVAAMGSINNTLFIENNIQY